MRFVCAFCSSFAFVRSVRCCGSAVRCLLTARERVGLFRHIDFVLPIEHDLLAGFAAWETKAQRGCMDYGACVRAHRGSVNVAVCLRGSAPQASTWL